MRQRGFYMNEIEIVACEERLRTAMLSSDVDQLDHLLADDLVFVNHLGQILSKEMDLEAHHSGKLKMTSIEFMDQKIRLMDRVAVTVTQVNLTGFFEKTFSGEFWYTRVWQYRSGEWQVVSGHCSMTAI